MKIDLGKILTRAWQIIWNNKILWVFGILAGFANGGSGGGNNGGGSNYQTNNNPSFLNGVDEFPDQIAEFFQEYMLIIIAVCVFLVLLSFVFYALGMMGRIGILKGVYKVEEGASSLVFAELWSESMPFFWRFFGLNFLIGLAFLVILLPIILISVATMGIGLACLLPLVCLLVPVGWVVSVVLEQAQAAIVAEDLNMINGLRRGWDIARSDIVGMIVLALILGIGGAIVGLVVALPIIIAVVPAVISLISAGNIESVSTVPPLVWVTVACCVLYYPVLLTLNGIMIAYIKSAWALSYLQLAKPTEQAPVFVEGNA